MQRVFQDVLPDCFVGIAAADDVFVIIPLPDGFSRRVARCVDARGNR